jgi:hypothetical protein
LDEWGDLGLVITVEDEATLTALSPFCGRRFLVPFGLVIGLSQQRVAQLDSEAAV